MPLVTVDIWEGRSIDVKKKLVKEITRVVSEVIGCPESAVEVIIRDIPMHNWGIGGELASEKFKR